MEDLIAEALRAEGAEGEMVRLLIDIAAQAEEDVGLRTQAIKVGAQLVRRRMEAQRPIDEPAASKGPLDDPSATPESHNVVSAYLTLLKKVQSPDHVADILRTLADLLSCHVNPIDAYSLWESIESSAPSLREELLRVFQGALEREMDPAMLVKRQTFAMHGPHAGIVAPAAVFTPSKKGYSFVVGLLLEPGTACMSLFSLRGAAGHGVSALLDGTTLLLATHSAQGSFTKVVVPLPDRARMEHQWTHLAIVHSKKMVFKDKISVFLDGAAIFTGNLPYPDAVQMTGGHNCVGTMPHFPCFQGHMWFPTLFGTSLSDAEVAQLHWRDGAMLLRQWLYENAGAADKSRFVFAYDARVCALATSACFDVSRNGSDGWLEPGTTPRITAGLPAALATLGGVSSLLYCLLQDSSLTLTAALAGLRAVIAGVQVSPRCRAHFLRCHGSKIVATILQALPSSSLSVELLDTVVTLVDGLSAQVPAPRLRTIVIVLFVMNGAWFTAPFATQLRLLGDVLPTYSALLETQGGHDFTVIDVGYWCGVLRTWYVPPVATPLTTADASLCCKLVLEKLIHPLLMPSKGPTNMDADPFVQLIVYLDDRLGGATAADVDVVAILRYLVRELSDVAPLALSGATSPPPVHRMLRQLLHWSPLCVWFKWLREPAADIRLLLLQAFEAMTHTLTLRYAEAVLLSSSLQEHPLEMPQCEVVLDICLGRLNATGHRATLTPRFACIPVVLLKLVPASPHDVQLYILYATAKALRTTGTEIVHESIRAYPEWLAILLPSCAEALTPPPPPTTTMDPDQLNDYCMVLVDDAASLGARIDMVRCIGAGGDSYGAEFMLTVLQSAGTPEPVKDAILHTVLASFPALAPRLAESTRLHIAADVLVYSVRHVRHGWVHLLEALFYLRRDDWQLRLLRSVLDAVVVAPGASWENLSQLAAVCTVWATRLAVPAVQLAPLQAQTKVLWGLVAPWLGRVPWAEASVLLRQGATDADATDDMLVHQLFAPLPIAQALALDATFAWAATTLATTTLDLRTLQAFADTVLHPPLPSDDGAPEMTIDMDWSARLQWRVLRALVELITVAPPAEVAPLDEWIQNLARSPAYLASTPLLEQLTTLQPLVPPTLYAEIAALDSSSAVKAHIETFAAAWETHRASSSVFNPALLVADTEVRASLLQAHQEELEAVARTMWSDADNVILYPIADVLGRLEADVAKAAAHFGDRVRTVRRLLRREGLPPPAHPWVKLQRTENELRMRLRLKPMAARSDSIVVSVAAAPEPPGLEASWRSDGASFEELTDMLSDATVRAVLRTATSSTVEEADDTCEYEGPSWDTPPTSSESVGSGERTFALRMTSLVTDKVQRNMDKVVDKVHDQLSGSVELLQDALHDKVVDAKAAIDLQVDHLRFVKDTLSEEATNLLDQVQKRPAARRRSSLDTTMKRFGQHDFVCKAQWICHAHIVAGELRVTDRELLFVSSAIVDEHGAEVADAGVGLKVHRILLDDMAQLYGRRYLLQVTALEVFVASSRKNYFFHICRPATVHDVHRAIMSKRPLQLYRDPEWRRLRHPSHMFKTAPQTTQWVNHEISTFAYLMWLNTVAGRTYNDVTQYPVFPWVLADYTSSHLDLTRAATFRDLSKPLGALNETRLAFYLERSRAFDDPDIPKFLYGSHYSHVGAVLYYLIRLEPFTSLARRVQGGRLDHADRLFHSVAETWANCLSDTSDLKELTPEWFYQPAFLCNANKVDLGTCQNGTVLGDVVLPPYATSAQDFIFKHMEALESEYVSAHIHEWIDLVFGAKQRGAPAVEANNVFFYLTYEGSVDIESIQDPVLQASMRAQIAHFGQTPTQLLKEGHPPRNAVSDALVPSVTPVLLPHAAPIVLLAFTGGNLFCLDASGQSSSQRFVSPFAASASPTKSTVGSPQRTARSPLMLSRSNSSADGGLIDVIERKTRRVLAADTWLDPIWATFLDAGNWVASGGHLDGSVRFYSAADGTFHSAVLHHSERVTCIAATTRATLACGSADGTVSLWTLAASGASSLLDFSLSMFRSATKRAVAEPDWSPAQVLLGHGSPVSALACCEDLGLIVSCSRAVCLVHHMVSGDVTQQLALPPEVVRVSAVGMSRLGLVVVAGGGDDPTGPSTVVSFAADGQRLAQMAMHERVTHVTLLERTGHVIVGGSFGATVLAAHTLAVVQPLTTVGVASIAVSTDEKFAILGLAVMPVQLLSANLVLA
ncbi:BEACH domain-containing protein [Achlya hypogyna]|uniref:BEACH domain-containing protein n=1 Tax=Achlya hypogyna TaxID=1202772 RepID=A0A1V9Z8D2_ACHHY|nr:BEACH domain-containing protein [Achlya hypogyna]